MKRLLLLSSFSLLLGPIALGLSGCTAPMYRNIPELGPVHKLVRVDEVPALANVMKEVRIQVGKAFRKFAKARQEADNPDAMAALEPKAGTMKFVGKTQLVNTGSGNLSAVFPFSGYTGSTLTPNFGVSTTATSSQQTTLESAYDPVALAAAVPAEQLDGYVTRALDTAFEQLVESVDKNGAGVSNRSLSLELVFMIAKSDSNGLGVSFIPSAPDLDSIGSGNPPMLGRARTRMGTYTLTIDVPFWTPTAGDQKTILTGVSNGEAFYLIERPYTPAEHERAYRFVEEKGIRKTTDKGKAKPPRVFGEGERKQ